MVFGRVAGCTGRLPRRPLGPPRNDSGSRWLQQSSGRSNIGSARRGHNPALHWVSYESENKLHHDHINHRACPDAEQGVPLPHMESGHGGTAENLRNAKGCAGKGHILEAVHHQHIHNGKGQHPAQICDDLRRFPVLAEDRKGRKPQGCCDEGADGDGENGVGVTHGGPPFRTCGP